MKKQSVKILLISVSLFLLAAACVKTANSPESYTPLPILSPTGSEAQNRGSSISPSQTKSGEIGTTPTPAQSSTISYKGVADKSALELLKSKYQVGTKQFSGLGEFVESINGVKPDSKHFWAFYVNGKSATLGASSYVTKNSDTIEWRLDEIK